MKYYDIVIIGAGPVGLNFARPLKGTGLKVLIVKSLHLNLFLILSQMVEKLLLRIYH